MGKYIEGSETGAYNMDMEREVWYHLNYHKDIRDNCFFPDDYLMLNVGLISSELVRKFGGLDCRFQVMAMAHNDLAVRLQNNGHRFKVFKEPFYKGTYLHADAEDHSPIHETQTKHDFPLFKDLYGDPEYIARQKINFDNWKKSQPIWKARFHNE